MWKQYFYQSWEVEVGEHTFAKCARNKNKKRQWESEKSKTAENEKDGKVRERKHMNFSKGSW